MGQLTFDSSGSATIRFYGKPCIVNVHWYTGMNSYIRLVCPESIGISRKICKLCLAHRTENGPTPTNAERLITQVWNVHRRRWDHWMAPRSVIAVASQKLKDYGISGEQISTGNSADVIIQRSRGIYEVAVMPETIGTPINAQKDWLQRHPPPEFEHILSSIETQSYWRFSATAEECLHYNGAIQREPDLPRPADGYFARLAAARFDADRPLQPPIQTTPTIAPKAEESPLSKASKARPKSGQTKDEFLQKAEDLWDVI